MQKGYTLFEMSIVLLIISLLSGTALWGLSVLRQAQIRAAMSDLDHYQQALQTFSDRYNQLPGDMANAESFWNDGAPCPGTGTTDAPAKITCRGNGDGKISPQDYDNGGGTNGDFAESFRAWQQLYDAGFVDQAMTGTIGPAGQEMRPGINVPQTAYGNAGYMLYYLHCTGVKFDGTASPCANYFPANYGHVLEFGGMASWAAGYAINPSLNPQEAWQIDSKIDDGNPASGKILVPATENACVTSTVPATAAYQATSSVNNSCSLLYITGL